MNRYRIIDRFLKHIANIAKENPNLDFYSKSIKNMIYYNLTRLGVDKEELNVDLSKLNYFAGWIESFKNKSNINCFVDPNWSYFCQFTNGVFADKDYIKMYVPLNSSHIYNGATMIFDFLAANNIEHISKIGKHVRFDNIVLRLRNKEDAELVSNFIKNNRYIQEGLISSNPFAYSKDNIAYACDGRISYNSTVAECIKIYIASKKENNQLDTVGVTDFYNFLVKYYKKHFEYDCNDSILINDFDIECYDETVKVNYQQVLNLIISSVNQEYNYDNFIDHYNICNIGKSNSINDNDVDTNTLLYELINVMSQKYGRDTAMTNIDTYLSSGSIYLITRTNNLRQKVQDSNFRIKLNQILKNKGISVNEYIDILSSTIINTPSKEDILKFGLQETYNKYETQSQQGFDYALNALCKLINENSYISFTRENGAREKVYKNIKKEDAIKILRDFCKDDSLSLYDMCLTYIDTVLDKKTIHKL